MKTKLLNSMRVLLVAALLGVGQSAWAYDTPNGYGVKNVFIGTAGTPDANGVITTVAIEDFEETSTLVSAWDKGTMSSVSIDELDEVALPDVGEEVTGYPTYVGGNTVAAAYRGRNYDLHAIYNFSSPITKGSLVFNGDLYHNSYTYHYSYISIVDTEGNNLLKIGFTTASGVRPIMCSYMNADGEQVSTGIDTTTGLTTIRTYHGYGIKDLVISPETGAFSFTIDFVNRDAKREQKIFSGTMKTGISIGAIYIGSVYTDSKNTQTNTVYLDNMSLYTIEPVYGYTINYQSTGSTIATDTGKDFEGATVNAAASVTVGGVAYTPTSGATTSLTITTTEASNVLNVPVEASVPYTINYVYNEETISSENGYAIVGNTVDASITTSLWNEGGTTKYYIADAATTTFPIAATGNTFTVDLRLANTSAIASVNAVCSGTTHKSFTATGVEGENVTIYYSIVVKSDVDNKFYSVTTTDYSKALTYGASVDVTYTLDESIVGFTEVEMGTNSEQSGGGNGAWNSKLAEATVNAGVYRADIMVVSKGGSGSNHRQEGVFVSDVNVVSLSGNTNGLRTLDFIVPSNETNVYVRGLGTLNYSDNLDYVIIRKTADMPATENIVVSAAGYATYVSEYNLDFSSATTKAYKVNVASKGVATLTEVSKVPAKTPVLLYCAGGNGTGEDIAITTDAVDAVTGNDLVVGTGAAVGTTDGEYTNMILNNVGGNVGFYFANGQTVATNRAYLHIYTSLAPTAASRMVMVFGDEATGIESVKSEEIKVKSEVFNLKGQRVSQPTKGLYIVNGKKVVIK